MKLLFRSFPIAIFTFLLGTLGVTFVAYLAFTPVVPKMPQKFEVYLETIEVKDSDPGRWNMNGGYLGMTAAKFVDENNVLALYSDGMHSSNDGGRTWKHGFRGGDPGKATEGFGIGNLEFLDSQTGWASGSCLISTSDGGNSWNRVRLPEWIDNITVKFLNRNIGFVAGRGGYCERGSGDCNLWMSVYKTIDGGKTWKLSFKTKDADTPWQIVVVDENIVMLTAEGSWLYRTADSGHSWKTVLSRDSSRVMSLSRDSDGLFWLFGKNSIRVSDDLGLTWRSVDGLDQSLINHEWWAVDFTTSGLGVAVSEDTTIIITHDSGRTWKKAISNLHVGDTIPVPDDPFDDHLRGIVLRGERGIVLGDQRDYVITIPKQSD